MIYLIQKLTTEHLKGMVEMTLKNWTIEAIMAELEELEGQEVYGADLGYKVFERYNVDGSYTYSTNEAIKWIGEFFSEIGDVTDNLEEEGLEYPNPFKEPETFQLVVMLNVASEILGQCETVTAFWDDEFILDNTTIKQITKELETIKD